MELEIIEDKKNRAVFKIKGDINQGFVNLLKEELWDDEHVKAAAYSIDHPLVGVPKMIVETDGDRTPKQAISDALKGIKKKLEKLEKDFKKEV